MDEQRETTEEQPAETAEYQPMKHIELNMGDFMVACSHAVTKDERLSMTSHSFKESKIRDMKRAIGNHLLPEIMEKMWPNHFVHEEESHDEYRLAFYVLSFSELQRLIEVVRYNTQVDYINNYKKAMQEKQAVEEAPTAQVES